jgi:hypothetical protein
VILLILVALLWIAVLAPGAITKISERRSSGSIDSFHDRLHLLERTGPKLIRPANRLERSEPRRLATAVGYAGVPAPQPAGRPALVLLETARPESEASAIDVVPLDRPQPPVRIVVQPVSSIRHGFDDPDIPAVRMLDGPSLGAIVRPEAVGEPDLALWRPPTGPAAAEHRSQAARRRRDVLGVLVTTMVLSGLLGIVPSLRPALIATAGAGFLLVVFVGLAIYAVSSRAARDRTSDLAFGPPTIDGYSTSEASHVGPLHRLGQPAPEEGDEEPELKRVVRAG